MWGSSHRLHFWLAIFWASMSIPTLLWFKESILYVAFLSLYALMVGHWAAYEAAKSGVQKGTLRQIHALADALADFMDSYHDSRQVPDEELRRAIDELRASARENDPTERGRMDT